MHRQSTTRTAANRYRRPRRWRGTKKSGPDWEIFLPARTRLRYVISTSSGYLRRRTRKTISVPARNEIPTIARLGSTSGAVAVLQLGVAAEQGEGEGVGLGLAAALIPSASTIVGIAYFRKSLILVLPPRFVNSKPRLQNTQTIWSERLNWSLELSAFYDERLVFAIPSSVLNADE